MQRAAARASLFGAAHGRVLPGRLPRARTTGSQRVARGGGRMKFVLFYHSLVSNWNHGNAHFLRGIAMELLTRGHEVEIYEPADGWSLRNLREQQGETAIAQFHAEYPRLS